MPGYFNVNNVVQCVKTIVDSNRCGFCEKLSGLRLRYSCGHTVCDECIELSDECLNCSNSSKTIKPLFDLVQNQHAQNAANLLTVFQETFNIDVDKQLRLSEKLKEEKQLFPECIQASATYYNKRKSSQISVTKDKENLSPLFIAGEQINTLESTTMNTRINLVQKWLDKNEKVQSPMRRPFADINVNSAIVPSKETNSLNNNKHYSSLKNSSKTCLNWKKRLANTKQNKSTTSPSVANIKANKSKNNLKKPDNKSNSVNLLTKKGFSKLENFNKSKICSDENLDIITIEETPTKQFDKDENAWLAVLESEKNHSNCFKETLNINNVSRTIAKSKDIANPFRRNKNVCFYKKALLYKSCQLCFNNTNKESEECQRLNPKDPKVSITINTNSIIASINIINNENFKSSVSTQTDILKNIQTVSTSVQPDSIKATESPLDEVNNVLSQDLFMNDENLFEDKLQGAHAVDMERTNVSLERPCHIISDSDSDEMDCSDTFEVYAEVHMSNEIHNGVLSAIDNCQRIRLPNRHRSVDSNNSSEKENVEPNKPKRPRLAKKHGTKK